MANTSVPRLIIDKGFQLLKRPLWQEKYIELENSLKSQGCISPIITWNNVIIDGVNRYEICRKYNIPFLSLEKYFISREEAIAYICEDQLKRTDISEEMRRYLIGTLYEAEKSGAQKNNNIWVSYANVTRFKTFDDLKGRKLGKQGRTLCKTANMLSEEYHVSTMTVQKYAQYSRALNTIESKSPVMFHKIISSRCRMSHMYVLDLAQRSAAEIKQFELLLEKSGEIASFADTRKAFHVSKNVLHEERHHTQGSSATSIKDTPIYHPDSEVEGLTLTIPAWVNSIDRVISKADFHEITADAKENLRDALHLLNSRIDYLLARIGG